MKQKYKIFAFLIVINTINFCSFGSTSKSKSDSLFHRPINGLSISFSPLKVAAYRLILDGEITFSNKFSLGIVTTNIYPSYMNKAIYGKKFRPYFAFHQTKFSDNFIFDSYFQLGVSYGEFTQIQNFRLLQPQINSTSFDSIFHFKSIGYTVGVGLNIIKEKGFFMKMDFGYQQLPFQGNNKAISENHFYEDNPQYKWFWGPGCNLYFDIFVGYKLSFK